MRSIDFKKVFRTSSESYVATEEDTSGREESFSKRKNTPLTKEKSNKRFDTRQRVEKSREKQWLLEEIQTTSTPKKKEVKSTHSDPNLWQKETPCNDSLKHSMSYTVVLTKDNTAATEGEISETEEEDEFIKSVNPRIFREPRPRRNGKRKKRHKRRAKQNRDINYETN